MKRPHTGTGNYRAAVGDTKSDFSQEQLAAIGTIAISYNEAEAYMESLFALLLQPPSHLRSEVYTRINGMEGVAEIIKIGVGNLALTPEEIQQIRDTIGAFGTFKKYRDAIIHARAYNVPLGIGIRVDRQARVFEVILTKDGLNALCNCLAVLRLELEAAAFLIVATLNLMKISPNDPDRAQLERGKADCLARFLSHQKTRRSLPQLPEFPSESELQQAAVQWQKAQEQAFQAATQAWISARAASQQQPARRRLPPPNSMGGETFDPPLPLTEAEKKK